MPTRMVRDWTDSEVVNKLSVHAERFFMRLMMKADDFGCYSANHTLLKSHLFPLLDDVRTTDIARWITECETSGLIACAEGPRGRFIRINNFGQRKRTMSSKWLTDDGHTPDIRPPEGKRREEEENGKGKPPTKTFGKPPGNFITVKAKYIHDPVCKIYGTQGLMEYMVENQTILNQPEYADRFLRAFNGQVYNELTHVQNAYRKFITEIHK